MRPAFKAYAVTLLALLIIWLVAPHWPFAAWLLGVIIAVLLVGYARTIRDLGLGWSNLLRALKAWRWAYILCALALAILVEWRSMAGATLLAGALYLLECVIQQFIYQHLICAPLAADFGPTAKSDWLSAALFSAVHLPNPILVPATFVWGLAASRLFRQSHSLWAVAIFQYLLSGILYALLPHQWHHPFRIGPRYFEP